MTTIRQSVTLPAKPEVLWATYLSAARHGAAIGSSVSMARKVAGRFQAFGGTLRGRILALVPGRLIVQTWRGSDWSPRELDSILILTMSPARGGGRIDLVHANIPARHAPRTPCGPCARGTAEDVRLSRHLRERQHARRVGTADMLGVHADGAARDDAAGCHSSPYLIRRPESQTFHLV